MSSKLPEVKGFIECSLSDWDGHVAAVIWLGGCNFKCGYCFNYDLVLYPENVETIPWKTVDAKIKAKKKWIDGVVITGGEPTCQKGLPELVKEIKKRGLKVKLDTNGSNPDMLKKLLPELDYVAMDIKGPLERYDEFAGVKVDTKKIKESIKLIIESGIDHEFRTTVISELTREDLKEIAELVKGCKRFFLQQFDPTKAMHERYHKLVRLSKTELEKLAQDLDKIVPTKVRAH